MKTMLPTNYLHLKLIKLVLLLLLTATACLSFAPLAAASGITIRPFLIDETLEPRGVATNEIFITSDHPAPRKATVYATVNEITVDASGEIKEFISPVMTDRTNTVTSWIEVSRGRITIPPGETATLPITVRTHPFAEPGEYHVFIGLVEAPNRPTAENIAMAGNARGVVLKVTIDDQRKDGLKIKNFLVDRFVTGEDSRLITVNIENTGDLPASPEGEVVFYDSRGSEQMAVPVSAAGKLVQPGEEMTLTTNVPIEGDLGRYKANLTLRYGERQSAALYDTTFFYLVPTQTLFVIFLFTLLFVLTSVFLLRRVFTGQREGGDFEEVSMYVDEESVREPQDHDIDLKKPAEKTKE